MLKVAFFIIFKYNFKNELTNKFILIKIDI